MTDAERFLEAVLRNYRENPRDLSFLFHPEGSLLLPGMDTPIPVDAIPATIAKQHAAVPDAKQVITHWAERDGVIFVMPLQQAVQFAPESRGPGAI